MTARISVKEAVRLGLIEDPNPPKPPPPVRTGYVQAARSDGGVLFRYVLVFILGWLLGFATSTLFR